MTESQSPLTRPLIRESSDAKLMAVLGPTNTGKTHYAIERMCGYASGMMGLPLRLLAREIYERVVALKGVNAVALITGEEKIIPRLPSYFICTVEAMPLERQVDFLAVDEIQLCGDTERGYIFTDRLLHARGRFETLFLGAKTFAPLFHRLFPYAEVMLRERLSSLKYNGPTKLTRLPKRTAIVAFSTEKVYAIAELIRRQRGGAAVVMGSLSPKTRNAQVDLFQKGEVDFLVATDAIGMGLNMDIAHVAFSGLSKFDGKSTRHLTAQEIGQIAGRAGRHMNDGTFGVTGECHDLDDDLVHAVENHEFAALDAAQWRNHKLEFSTLDALLKSLTLPSHTIGLHLAKEALDEKALRHLSQDEEVATKIKNPVSLRTLWDACQLPDFRKTGLDEHLKLVSFLFWARITAEHFVPEEWFQTQIHDLDKMDGDIDTLSSRLSGVRTLSYIANRGGWLARNDHWRDITRDLEERLSDKLHEALMQRFIDTRTSALLKALDADEAPRPEVTPEGQVIIEGHVVGELKGLMFKPAQADSLVEGKTLRQAANRAVVPILRDRLRDLGNAASKTLRIKGSDITWNNETVARVLPGDLFAPRIKLLSEIDHPAMTERAVKRLGDYVRVLNQGQLKWLWKLKLAADLETNTAPVRAIAFQLFENGGILRRDDTQKLSPEDKAALKALGVHGNRYIWFMPEINKPKVRQYMRGFGVKGDQAKGQYSHSLKGDLDLADYGPVSTRLLGLLDRIIGNGIYQKGSTYVRESDFAVLGLPDNGHEKLLQAVGLVKTPAVAFAVTAKPVVVAPVAEAEVEEVETELDVTDDVGGDEAHTLEAAAEGVETPAVEEPVVEESLESVVGAPVVEAPVVEAPVVEETSAEPTAAEEVSVEEASVEAGPPVMEERIGWRQKSLEPRAPRPKRPARPERKPAVAREGDVAGEGKPRNERGRDRHRGPKPQGQPGENRGENRGESRGENRGDKRGDKRDRNRGGKPDQHPDQNRGLRPAPKPSEPYVNPFSPFAVLLGKIK